MTAPTTSAASAVLAELGGRGLTVGCAESLTGGLVCAALTDVPGSSAVVRGAVVSYAAGVKESVLGVPAAVLEGEGAVSKACAEAMAGGVRGVLGCDWAVATTGVAGPGPSEGKEAGTVHVAVVGPGPQGVQIVTHQALQLDGSRSRIRALTVERALELLLGAVRAAVSDSRGTVEDHADPSGPPAGR